MNYNQIGGGENYKYSLDIEVSQAPEVPPKLIDAWYAVRSLDVADAFGFLNPQVIPLDDAAYRYRITFETPKKLSSRDLQKAVSFADPDEDGNFPINDELIIGKVILKPHMI